MFMASAKQEHLQEIIRCGKDPLYFINNYVKIQHPIHGIIQFKTFPCQDRCINDFTKKRHNIILKSRQLGLSTLTAAYVVWLSIFYKDKTILVIATKLSTAQNFIKKVKVALDNVPPWLLMPKVMTGNKCTYQFDNGSSITAVPTSDDAGRSEALSLLVVDEAAFVRNFEDIWSGLLPTLSTGGKAILISTPNGVGGQYHDLWVNAEAGQNEFNPIKLPWDSRPERDATWYEKTKSNMSKRKFAREYLCDFSASGETFLQPECLELLRDAIVKPIECAGVDHNVWIWKHPIVGAQYAMSADVSRGDASDYSTFHIVDIATNEVIAEYMGKLPPDMFGTLLNEWGLRYNKALVCPENNTFGYSVCHKLQELKYPRLFYNNDRSIAPEYVVNDTSLPGLSMQKGTRLQVLTKLEEMIRNRTLHVYSQRFYNQMQTFIWTNGKATAMKGHNDDLVMSLAISTWMLDSSRSKIDSVNQTRALLKSVGVERRLVSDILPQMQIQTSTMANPQYRAISQQSRYTQSRMRGVHDLSWLLR